MYLGAAKKLQKFALLITPKDKCNKQQIKLFIFFIGNQHFSTDLIFRSQQVWGDKKHVSVQLWLVSSCALSAVLSIQKGC